MNRRLKRTLQRFALYASVVIVVFFAVAPILWTLVTSLSPQVELLDVPPHWIPERPTLSGYATLLSPSRANLLPAVYAFNRAMINSLVVSLVTTLICLILGALAAYAFARLQFRGRSLSFYIIIFTQMLPSISLVVPLYIILSDDRLQLTDTLPGLIIVYVTFTLPFTIWVMRSYFQTIPRDLEEAAMVDGCSRLSALLRIVIPLSVPGLAATSIFSFLNSWGEFLMAVVFTSSPAAETVPVVISQFSGVYTIDYQLMAAAGVLACVPPILIALFLSDLLVRGLTEGAVKA